MVASKDKAQKAADVLTAMARDGMSTRKACEHVGVPIQTFRDWVDADADLTGQYARARESLIEKMAEDLLDITDAPVNMLASGGLDSAAVAKQRLQADTRKWLLSKLAPKKYGDKLAISGDEENPLQTVTRVEIVAVSTDKTTS